MSNGRGTAPFYAEIMDQPTALRRLLAAYAAPDGLGRLAGLPPARRPVLVGMGASYHAALIAAHHYEALGLEVRAYEASDAIYGDPARLNRASPLIYISQSGASGEVAPLLERLAPATPLVALTNDEASPLAQRAQSVLPLLAGDERTVATKTYLNSLALLWLMGCQWTVRLDSAAFDALRALTGHIAALLDAGPALADRWLARLGEAQVFVFIGTGALAVTARQAAMMTMEWVKLPALHFSVGAFRHGPIEIAQPGLGAVVFSTSGPAQSAARRLAQQLEGYGAAVLVVEGGQTFAPAEAGLDGSADGAAPDDLLTQMLAVVPVQIFVEALAGQRGTALGFRHIEKVMTGF